MKRNLKEMVEKFALVNSDQTWNGEFRTDEVIRELYFASNFEGFDSYLDVKDIVNIPVYGNNFELRTDKECQFDPKDITLDVKEYKVENYRLDTEMCSEDIRKSFLAEKLRSGMGVSIDADVESFIANMIVEQAGELLSKRIYGISNLESVTFEASEDVDVESFDIGTVNEAVDLQDTVAAFEDAFEKLVCSASDEDLLFVVSDDLYRNLRISGAKNSDQTKVQYIDGALYFMGIEVRKECGFEDSTIIYTHKRNLVKVTDADADRTVLEVYREGTAKLANKWKAGLQFRFKLGYKVGKELVIGLRP